MFNNSKTIEQADTQGVFPELKVFEAPFHQKKGVVSIVFPEFTCLCPKTGYPDFAEIGLYYLPKEVCIELKSWKVFLNSFRMVGTFHEEVTDYLFNRVSELLKPEWLLIIGDFFPRGNVDTTVVLESSGTRPSEADFLVPPPFPRCRGFHKLKGGIEEDS